MSIGECRGGGARVYVSGVLQASKSVGVSRRVPDVQEDVSGVLRIVF